MSDDACSGCGIPIIGRGRGSSCCTACHAADTAAYGGFVDVLCCGEWVCGIQRRILTPAASKQALSIQTEAEDLWRFMRDPRWIKLRRDPASFEPRADGPPGEECSACGAVLLWQGGELVHQTNEVERARRGFRRGYFSRP